MTVLAKPKKRRVSVDPRVVVGVVLIVAAVAGTVGIVRAADRTVEVYAASETILPGSRVDAASLVATRVRLDRAERLYLAGALPSAGLIATREIAAGELVPRTAVGSSGDAATARVVVTPSGRLAESVQRGANVDLWAATKNDDGGFASPTVLVSGAVVARIIETDGFVRATQQPGVELQVPRERVAAVLHALAAEDSIQIVGAGEAAH